MIIYHGNPNPRDIKKARELAPSFEHRAEYDIESFRLNSGVRYILDNGAYKCYTDNRPWDATLFIRRLNQIPEKEHEPDFVILPDVVTDPQGTYRRAREWADWIDYSTLYPCQDGISPERACNIADELDADGLFIGGTIAWKRENAAEFVEAGKNVGLHVHIGRPTDFKWAEGTGCDSIDSTTFVRNQSWHRLKALEEQGTLHQTMKHD